MLRHDQSRTAAIDVRDRDRTLRFRRPARRLDGTIFGTCPTSSVALFAVLVFASETLSAVAMGPGPAPGEGRQPSGSTGRRPNAASRDQTEPTHHETINDPWLPRPVTAPSGVQIHQTHRVHGPHVSVQVNVDAFGENIPGDAANEPSIAVDPNDPNRIVIGWRQFDSVESDFRQPGYSYSTDGGQTWTFPGSISPGEFGSDPVLAVSAEGVFFYVSIAWDWSRVYRSFDGGMTWAEPIGIAGGLADKPWMAIDRTGGPGDGFVYLMWSGQPAFTRSVDGGETYDYDSQRQVPLDDAPWGTMDVSANGELLLVDRNFDVAISYNAQDAAAAVKFRLIGQGLLGASLVYWGTPNPQGLLGQAWIATDHPPGPCRGRVYVLGSVLGPTGSLDVMFARSLDGGYTWSDPIRINDDSIDSSAYQWFGTMSVAPNGRIDAIWNDTRNSEQANFSELYYAFSLDGGATWSANVAVSPMFDSHVGWPAQYKIGDYYDMVSDDDGAYVAYAATFNGEQDVYFLWIPADCDLDGVSDAQEIAEGTADDCSGNGIPDECEPDCNHNDREDGCDILLEFSEDHTGNGIPDECEWDLDRDQVPDGCDGDLDGDGVPNAIDRCVRTPFGAPIGGLFGDVHLFDTNADCQVTLTDFGRLRACLERSGPGVFHSCAVLFDTDGDEDIDLVEVAGFQVYCCDEP